MCAGALGAAGRVRCLEHNPISPHSAGSFQTLGNCKRILGILITMKDPLLQILVTRTVKQSMRIDRLNFYNGIVVLKIKYAQFKFP
jgi:hypothetical protein